MRILILIIYFMFFSYQTILSQKVDTLDQDSLLKNLNTMPGFQIKSLADSEQFSKKGYMVSHYPFRIGEKLEFEIKYGFIKAGRATMEVVDTLKLFNRTALLIQTTAKSSKGFDPFFKVRDTVQSYVDYTSFLSLKFIKKLREGGYFYDLKVIYNLDSNIAHISWVRYKDYVGNVKKKDSTKISIPSEIYDVLASFYKIRTYQLDVDSVVYITNNDNKKIYDLRVQVLKRETVKVPAGKFRCLKIEPKLKGEAIFKQKGRLWIWVTDDEYKIPVKMSSKVMIGSITTVLKKIVNGPYIIPAKLE